MKWNLFIIFIAVTALGNFVYTEYHKVTTVLKIGYVSPLTGDAATYGEPMKRAAEMAVEEINAAGGINGRKLEMIFEDSQCRGKVALSAVQKLYSIDEVNILSGFACAEDVLTAASFIEEKKIITLAPGASGPNVSLAGDYIFQTDPSSTLALDLLVQHAFKKYRKLGIISEQTGFAEQNKDYVEKVFRTLGGEVVISETYTSETKDFRSIALKIKSANPEAIFVNPQTEVAGGLIIKQMREMGIQAPIFGIDILSGPQVLAVTGGASEGMTLFTVPDLDPDNSIASEFLSNYKRKYNDAPFALYLAAAYDSIYLIANAIEHVGDNPSEIKDYLYSMPDYHGAVGTYHFDRNGDITGINFVVKQVKNGELTEVQ